MRSQNNTFNKILRSKFLLKPGREKERPFRYQLHFVNAASGCSQSGEAEGGRRKGLHEIKRTQIFMIAVLQAAAFLRAKNLHLLA
jgi:hypothetical protein